jgi:sporulation protein YlmC with PRC-barrel domain
MRLSDLLGLRLVDADGRNLGRLMDLRGPITAMPQDLRIREIVYGERGFMEKIGFGKGEAKYIRWSAAECIADRVVRLRRSTPV